MPGVGRMSAYLKFFQLECSPFDTGPQSSVVLGTRALRDAYAQIEAGIREQAPRICVDGGAGLGKTSLARAMPKLLRDQARVVLLLNPALSWSTLRAAIIRQLDLEGGILSRTTLLERRNDGQRLVVVIDAAEKISGESLEHLDILLAYRTDDDEQLIHCVLLANLEQARQMGDCPLLWWLDSLNTLQLEFAPIPVGGVRSYIVKHLKRAGWTGGDLFNAEAARAIHRITGGVPRSVSELCERVLTEAAEQSIERIDAAFVETVCGERPGTEMDTAQAEVVLDQVATAERPDVDATTSRRADGADTRTDTAPVRTLDPRVDPTAPTSGPATGLDAYFGPAPHQEHAPVEATGESDFADPAQPFEADADYELDAEARGGFVRWLALAAGLLALIGAGLYFAGVVPGSDAGDASSPIADTADRAALAAGERPTPAERLERLAEDAAKQRAAVDPTRGANAVVTASDRNPDASEPLNRQAAAVDWLGESAKPTDGDGDTAAAPPASPARFDPMDLGKERHF